MKILLIILSLFTFNLKITPQEVKTVETNDQGKYVKYYPNGQMMVEGYKTNELRVINKYGFDDGSYVTVNKKNSIEYYNLYNGSDSLILTTKEEGERFDKTISANCPKSQMTSFQFPQRTLDKDLEGLVILQLIIGTDGKLKDIKPIKGFEKKATEDSMKSMRRINCYWIAIKNGVPVEYDLIKVIKYELND